VKAPTASEMTRQGPPSASANDAAHGGLSLSVQDSTQDGTAATLGSLPVGARLILRCRADWRAATVAAYEAGLGRVILNVASPKGGTYRVRRPADARLSYDGHVPLLGEGQWRAAFARYDVRW
jgi:hypothetical protein